MSFIKKFLTAVIVIVVLGGVFYFISGRTQESDTGGNHFSNFFSRDREDTAENRIFLNPRKFIESGLESVERGVQEKGSNVLNFLKEGVSETIDAVGEKIGIKKDDGDIIQVFPQSGSIKVVPATKAGTKTYFLILNPESEREVQYEIDWGDGLTESGVLSGESKTVFHSWDRQGEFLAVFRTSGSDFVSESIRIFVTE